MTDALPDLALSVRQPWAWAIIFAGKHLENRSQAAIKNIRRDHAICQRIVIHASKGMTQEEYRSATEFMAKFHVACPPAADLDRGCIIGTVDVVDVIRMSHSFWFFGPRALVLERPAPVTRIPCTGALGYFRWKDKLTADAEHPKPWMLKPSPTEKPNPETSPHAFLL